MRWVVYTLLAVNLGLLSWNLHTHGATGPVAPAAAPARQQPQARAELPLLSELGKDGVRARPDAALVAPGSTARAPGQNSAPASGTAEADAHSAPPDLTQPGATACYTLGPLDAGAPVEDMRVWLDAKGASVDVHIDERREVTLHWVFFPPRASRAEALAEVARMRAQGIEDIVVVPKGDMANAISLGVFSRTEGRDRRLQQLSKKGHHPSTAPRYRAKVATWVDVSAPQDRLALHEIQQRWTRIDVSAGPCSVAQLAASTGNDS